MPTKPRDGNEPFKLEDVTVKKETDKALLIEYEGEDVWIPKSAVHDNSEVYRDEDAGTLVVFTWFAEKEGLD